MGERELTMQLSLGQRVEDLANFYLLHSSIRDSKLFTLFLPKGYRLTTLSSVSEDLLDEVILSKVYLGMLITLYDDLADNPKYYNPKLLKGLYQLSLDQSVEGEGQTFELALVLFMGLSQGIERLPHSSLFKSVLEFDLKQIFLANMYSELLTANPYVGNLQESRMHGPYNMGMVAAGMIDIMASPFLDLREVGRLREIFIQGQRIGRIANLISTFERELKEGDSTNEILLAKKEPDKYKQELVQEMESILEFMQISASSIKSVDITSYLEGLKKLYLLHLDMKGVI